MKVKVSHHDHGTCIGLSQCQNIIQIIKKCVAYHIRQGFISLDSIKSFLIINETHRSYYVLNSCLLAGHLSFQIEFPVYIYGNDDSNVAKRYYDWQNADFAGMVSL